MSEEKTVEERLAELEKEIEAIKSGDLLKPRSIYMEHLNDSLQSKINGYM